MGKILLVEMSDRIQAARQYAKLSVAAFAKRVGISREGVRLWELPRTQGGTQPRPDHIDKIVEVSKVNKTWLLSGAGPMVGDDPGKQTVAELSVALRKLSSAEQDELFAQVLASRSRGDGESSER